MPPPKTKNKRTRMESEGDSDSENETRILTGCWPSWLIVESAEEDRPLSGLSPFAIAKGIQGLSGVPRSVKKLRNGSLLVETKSKTHSDLLLKSTMLVDRPIKVTAHKSLNSTRGVIRCRDLREVPEAVIKDELASQGVIDVRRVLVRKGQERVPTDTYFLTFCMTILPQTLKVGYLRVSVSLYVPSPLRCFKCQKFGHVRERCREEEVCGVCSKAVHEGACKSPALCVNCGGDHPSSSKTCPTWLKEKAVQQVKTERRIPFFEAKKIVETNLPSAGLTYSAAVKKVSVASIGVQTDEILHREPSEDQTKRSQNVKTQLVQTKTLASRGSAGPPSSHPSVQWAQSAPTAQNKRPSLPPKPQGGPKKTGSAGPRVAEVVEKSAASKPQRQKSPPTGKGAGGSSDRPKKGNRNFNRFSALSDEEVESDMKLD